MRNQHENQQGFAIVEALLVVVIVGMIGFVGWYVYSAQKDTDKTLDAASKSQVPTKTVKPKPAATNDETSKWLLYTSPGNEFSMRLADGWKLERYQKTPALYTFSSKDLTYASGVKAVVTEVEGGKDGSGTGLSISYADTSSKAAHYSPPDGSVQSATFQTTSGIDVKTYEYTETRAQVEGMGAIAQGGKIYSYILDSSKGHSMYVYYGFEPGDTDTHLLVEKCVKTISFN